MALLSGVGAPHGFVLKLLPEWQSQALIPGGPNTIIDHSIVGSGAGAWYYFRDGTGTESHFIVLKSGVIWQLMDTARVAHANLNANKFAVSIETEDNGRPDTDPWTTQQLASLKWLHRKLAAVHPSIPRKRCTSCCSGGGLGIHRQCPAGGGCAWTSAAGKTCPGDVRVAQWTDTLLPDFLATPSAEEDPFMSLTATDITNAFKAAAPEIAAQVKTALDSLIASPVLFVSNKDNPSWGVFMFTPLGLVHVQSPGQFTQLSGEGLGEGNVIPLPNANPIWRSVPLYTELAVPTPADLGR